MFIANNFSEFRLASSILIFATIAAMNLTIIKAAYYYERQVAIKTQQCVANASP